MIRRAFLGSVLVLFALGCLVPGFGAGLSLCIEGGPGGHVAIERGPCGGEKTESPCGPAPSMSEGDCHPCLDIPLASNGPVRLSPPVDALPMPSRPVGLLLSPAAGSPASALDAAPPPRTRIAVHRRI